jgi:tripartite-type tricarboxylate transporter receptor subunit TctC
MRDRSRILGGCCNRWTPAVLVLTVLLAAACGVVRANAEIYPDHPVKIIVPFPAGGTADAVPRLVGDWLSRKWGQPVVIENHAGAGGNIGAEIAYRAAPDGYTLLCSPPPPLVVNQNLYPELGFDPTEFAPIVLIAKVPTGVFANPDKVKANTIATLIDELRQGNEAVTVATQGIGTTSHLTSELFQMMAKVKLRNVPYRGSEPALQGLLAGDVDLMFDNLGVSLPLVEAGKLKLLAVATPQRMSSLPQVPTVAETLPGFESAAWYAIVAPPKAPKAIVEKINADVNEALHQPELQERLKKLSAEIHGGSVADASDYMRAEVARWSSVIKAAHITVQ